jgi:hypothetical protein
MQWPETGFDREVVVKNKDGDKHFFDSVTRLLRTHRRFRRVAIGAAMQRYFEVEVTRTVTERRKIYVIADNLEEAHDAAVEHAEWEKVEARGVILTLSTEPPKQWKLISLPVWMWPSSSN